jgi:hypothetical protein
MDRAACRQIANLCQQHLEPARRWRDARRLRLTSRQPRRSPADPEHDKGDNQEVDQRIDQQADVDGRCTGFLR